MIQFQVAKSVVLDLFSGSGSLAIEASSRGAIKVIAIENSKQAYDVIQTNIDKLEITNIELYLDDAISYICRSSGKLFDLIFIDPPFANFDIYSKVLKLIVETKILKKHGLIIFETSDPKRIDIPLGLVIQKQRRYGISYVLLVANNI